VYVTQALGGERRQQEAAGAPPPDRQAWAQFGGGDDFDRIEFAGLEWQQRDPSAAPLVVDLAWRLAGLSGTEHRSTIAIADGNGQIWHEETRPLFGGAFAMHDWREGQTLRERRSLDLTTLPPGRYRALLGLQDARGRTLPIDSGTSALEIATFDLPYHRPLWERLTGRLGRLAIAPSGNPPRAASQVQRSEV
jgi:hypothetical protein